MHIKYAAALAIVALAPEISGHAVWDNAIGDADPTIRGYVIGKQQKLENRKGTTQIPFQQDIPVLKNPIVPPGKQSKWWGKPRTYWQNGCGATIHDQDLWWKNHKDKKMRDSFAKLAVNRRNPVIYQIPVKKMLDWAGITKTMAKTNQLIKVSPGGWIRIMHYQVNADGAGPLKCKISSTGQPSNWNPGWIVPAAKDQVPGPQKNSFRAQGTMQLFPFTVTIPKNIKCTGTYEGRENICMMRCENFAANGPFGGCIPFQLILPEPEAPPPPPPPVPDNSENIGETTEADKVKLTDADEEEVAAAAGPEVVDETADPAAVVESKAETANEDDIKDDKADDTPEEDAADKKMRRIVKRQSDDDALAVALGGEDTPPAQVEVAKQQLKKLPAAQKAQLKSKLNAGKAANKAAANKAAPKKPVPKKPAPKKPAPKKGAKKDN
ncbi:uncharacterized protein DFL_004426 [Arthrobotrys flagrans]|uniref:Uncharacterized protein n=1 Tax=Arthrobotrys flagrans TaxID=97331 RepID=A0A437A4W1_ARTFL|nr:hypothetical protein DFL_004426 [Arthrobotrys flagrans]